MPSARTAEIAAPLADVHGGVPFNCYSAYLLVPLLLAVAGLVMLSAMVSSRPEASVIRRLTAAWDALSLERSFGWTRERSRAYQIVTLRVACLIAAFLLVFAGSNLIADTIFYCIPHR